MQAMRRRTRFWLTTAAGVVIVAVIVVGAGTWYLAMADRARLPESETVGAAPELPPPNRTLLPTVDIAAR